MYFNDVCEYFEDNYNGFYPVFTRGLNQSDIEYIEMCNVQFQSLFIIKERLEKESIKKVNIIKRMIDYFR